MGEYTSKHDRAYRAGEVGLDLSGQIRMDERCYMVGEQMGYHLAGLLRGGIGSRMGSMVALVLSPVVVVWIMVRP